MDDRLMSQMLMRYREENLDWAGLHVRTIVENEFTPSESILDVGAGKGKYRLLLPEYSWVDAVEVWEPYITGFRLREMYRNVYERDIVEVAEEFRHAEVKYDVVIMGDVLEHLSVHDAIKTLRHFRWVTNCIIVVIPYSYEQGEEHGNPYQVHKQPDLTIENMHERYPNLKLDTIQTDAAGRPFKGLYRWR